MARGAALSVDQRHFALAQAYAQLRQPQHDPTWIVFTQIVTAGQRSRLGVEICAAERREAPHQDVVRIVAQAEFEPTQRVFVGSDGAEWWRRNTAHDTVAPNARATRAKRDLEAWALFGEHVEVDLTGVDVHAVDVEHEARVADGERGERRLLRRRARRLRRLR